MSDPALKQVEELILGAVPAYEMYLLQAMGKPFFLKLPLLHTTPEQLRVTFESVETPPIGLKKPERLIMWVELNRAMGSLTVSTEYWQDIDEPNPTATSEASVDATQENLLAPAFAFGWLHKLTGGAYESDEETSMESIEESRMEQAEALILKANEVLAELGYEIDCDSYESYANTIEEFALRADIDQQTEDLFKKVGNVVRKAAHAYGAVKGAAHGVKQRWGNFKASVKHAYDTSHDKAKAKWSGDTAKKTPGTTQHAFAGAADTAKAKFGPAKGSSKVAKGRAAKSGGDAGAGKGRYPGGKMGDDEYKKRYGARKRVTASAETPDLDSLMDSLRDKHFESQFGSLTVAELTALEELVDLMHTTGIGSDDAELHEKAKVGSGERFKTLVKNLKMREAAVQDPKALAAWIGRKKYGKDKFQKLSAKGRESVADDGGARVEHAVSTFAKLSGLVQPMQSWNINKSR